MNTQISKKFWLSGFAIALLASAGCAVSADEGSVVNAENDNVEDTASVEQSWDSADGNPTHATHSYMTEYAINSLKALYPEVQTYSAQLVDGSNRELHELPITGNAEQEALRIQIGGTNWAADHPEILWQKARTSYAAGDKAKAYWYVGIILHFVADMGAPSHAYHIVHQGTLSEKDNFEACALQTWNPLYSINRTNPVWATPDAYLTTSSDWAKADWTAAYPGKTYTLKYYPTFAIFMSSTQKTLLRNRQGRTATAVTWALRSAVTHW